MHIINKLLLKHPIKGSFYNKNSNQSPQRKNCSKIMSQHHQRVKIFILKAKI